MKLAIRAMLALAPAGCALLAFVIACFYPISEARAPARLAGHRAPPPRRGRRGPGDRPRAGAARGARRRRGHRLVPRPLLAPRAARATCASAPAAWCAAPRSARGSASRSPSPPGSSLAFTIGDLSADPGLGAVLEVVVAGFAMTGLAYHARPPARGAPHAPRAGGRRTWSSATWRCAQRRARRATRTRPWRPGPRGEARRRPRGDSPLASTSTPRRTSFGERGRSSASPACS